MLFAGVSLLSGWAGVLLNELRGHEHAMESPGTLVWIAIPPLLGLGLRRLHSGRFLPRRSQHPDSPTRRVAWAAALLTCPIVTAGVVGLAVVTGLADTSQVALAGVGTLMARALVPALMKNLAEETAWRGDLTEELLTEGVGRLRLNQTVGTVWGL